MDLSVGDVVKMKKQHPCGGAEWKVLRIGADFKIECLTCGRQVMLTRVKFEKEIKKILSGAGMSPDSAKKA